MEKREKSYKWYGFEKAFFPSDALFIWESCELEKNDNMKNTHEGKSFHKFFVCALCCFSSFNR